MQGSYNTALVALSVLIAILASYCALDLAARATSNEGRWEKIWLVGGAFSMGAGVWSMHFIGMLAFSLPIPLAYDIPITIASLLIAVASSGVALYVASRKSMSSRQLWTGGVLMGIGICSMHYSGMAAMRMSPSITYAAAWFAVSVAIAISASIVALYLAFMLRGETGLRGVLWRVTAAMLLGAAISGMHYSGMTAAQFAPDSICTVRSGFELDGEALAYLVGLAILALLASTLAVSIFDARLSGRLSLTLRQLEHANRGLRREIEERTRIENALRGSQEQFRSAFENAPIGMVLSDHDGRWKRVNQAMGSMLGFTQDELMQRGYRGAVHPEDYKIGVRAIRNAMAEHNTAFQIELRYLHRDGHSVPVRVSVSVVRMEETEADLYVVQIDDISQYRHQHERIVRLNRVHALLTGVSSRIVRTRERQALFEQICSLAVEAGGFRFAWIGAVAVDDGVTPVAHCGVEDGYLSTIRPALAADRPEGDNPTAVMVRERRMFVANDIASNPIIAKWRTHAQQNGYRSMVSLPLIVHERVIACFNLYAGDADFFDAEELRLLTSLGEDVSYALEFIAHSEETAYLAYHDPLTSLGNRKRFLERLNERLQLARSEGRQVAVAMVDLDHFKSINDAWGQAAGDRMLIMIAARLTQHAQDAQSLARIAADRFALVFPTVDDSATLAGALQDQVLDPIAQPMTVFGQNLRISAKAGLAIFPIDGEDAESLLRNAESALKHAKRSGEPLYYYTRQLSAAVRERMELENRLRHAIARNEFCLHYQPKLQLDSGQVTGVEALLRWNSPDMGMVPPQQFVPLLEETGLIRDVGLWVLDEALRASREWSLIRGETTPRIAINVSSLQLQQADFVERVSERLLASGDGPYALDLEVTESLMLGEMSTMLTKLNALRALGLRIAIDDFGTGYSSLTYLARLPVDALKIDRSFIVSMIENAAHVSMVETIISMAHSLGLKVIAEGVDSIEQLRKLRRLRCDEVQGFLFSRPVPFARLDAVVDALQMGDLGADEVTRTVRRHIAVRGPAIG